MDELKNVVRKKGEIIICNQCNTPILELAADVVPGQIVTAEQLKGIGKQSNPTPGESMVCKICNQSYAKAFYEFTNMR